MSNVAIRVENLSKRYRIGLEEEQHDTLGEAALAWLKSPVSNYRRLKKLSRFQENGAAERDVIWALKDVSFEVEQGEVIGIIGRNGAGKSTLLKILSRITEPTSGRAVIEGRVASLLEVGTGFHQELTGRENVYLNGTVLGMKKAEVDRKFDEIVAFSGVEQFIDTPVKRYSSGMKVRLAFAVAAHLEPEVLLIDEVLAVGDWGFQRKCLGKMEDVTKEGRTVLFVSHQLDMVRSLCDRTILLDSGLIVKDGPTESSIDFYSELMMEDDEDHSCFTIQDDADVSFQILSGRLKNEKGEITSSFDMFEPIIVEFDYVVRKRLVGSIINFELTRRGETLLVSFDTDCRRDRLKKRIPGHYRTRVRFPCPLLKPGRYILTPGTGIANRGKIQHLENALKFEVSLHSRPASHASYARKRSGLVAAELDWNTVLVETASTMNTS